MERYRNAENLAQAIIQSEFEYSCKSFAHTMFNVQNYNILSQILIGESSRNLIVHPGSNALFVASVISAALACYTQDVLSSQTSLLDTLKDGDRIVYERNRGIYKGFIEINGELKLHMVFNGLSRYVPLSNGYKISPYLGDAKTLSKGINKKSITSRSEALGQLFGVSPESIKNVTESSILVICQKFEADAIAVDDQFGVRLLLGEIFQDDNHEVKMAVNGFEALQLLSSFEPAIILLDMKMPGMNGIETLEKIRAVDRRVTVIMMTGNDDPHNMEQAKNLGILCYITKPFDLFKLKEQVGEILNTLSDLLATPKYSCSLYLSRNPSFNLI